MAKSGYSITTEGAVALGAATAKTILGVKSGATTANHGVDLKKFRVSFDGVTASAVPVVVEVCLCSFSANAPGTNSTALATPGIVQAYGRAPATGFTAAKNWTTEPTALTVIESFLLTPNGGVVFYDWPLGDTPDSALGEGFAIRCTAPATVNVRAGMLFERC
ncbi:hypothetical protein ACFYUV_20505 [Nonomuraea sp. NPDC003560]|uniref:hypothetical protein n=1 Tax=Nonomuraea sp. NPDC003560 TaxID=3364341 RepID=UPI00368DE547